MDKKTMILVGAGKGMGNHIAKVFALHGFRVILIARRQEQLRRYTKDFETLGLEVFWQTADVTDADSLKKAFERIQKQFGVADVLVYNVAVREAGFPSSLSADELMKRYQVDVVGAVDCARQLIPYWKQRGEGTLLFTGGGFALYPMAEYTSVSLDKAALRTLAYAFHSELRTSGIFAGIVTIMGNVVPGTHYAPEQIAEKYWQLYVERKDCEIIYR